MKGRTIKERAKRRKELEKQRGELAKKYSCTTAWMPPTAINVMWLKQEVAISKWPGHGKRYIIKNKSGSLWALARRTV